MRVVEEGKFLHLKTRNVFARKIRKISAAAKLLYGEASAPVVGAWCGCGAVLKSSLADGTLLLLRLI